MSTGGKGRPWLLLQNRRPCSMPWKASWWLGTWGEAGLQPRTGTRSEPCPAVLWPLHLCLALRVRQGREGLRLCPPTPALGGSAHGWGALKVPPLASTVDLPAIRRPAPGCRCPLGPVWAKWREEAVGVGPLAHWVVGWADCKGRFAPPHLSNIAGWAPGPLGWTLPVGPSPLLSQRGWRQPEAAAGGRVLPAWGTPAGP